MRAWDYPERERGSADYDVPYVFGRHPTLYVHVLEFARLLILRGKLADRPLLRHRGGTFTPEPADD